MKNTVSGHATLMKRTAAAPGQRPQAPVLVKDLGTFDGVPRDLRESPFFFDLDLHDIADGPYLLNVEVLDRGERICSVPRQITLRKGLDDTVAHLEAEAAKAPEALRAEILFPVDPLKKLHPGRLHLR